MITPAPDADISDSEHPGHYPSLSEFDMLDTIILAPPPADSATPLRPSTRRALRSPQTPPPQSSTPEQPDSGREPPPRPPAPKQPTAPPAAAHSARAHPDYSYYRDYVLDVLLSADEHITAAAAQRRRKAATKARANNRAPAHAAMLADGTWGARVAEVSGGAALQPGQIAEVTVITADGISWNASGVVEIVVCGEAFVRAAAEFGP